MKKILILNGANLNLTGQREPEIYGTTSFDDLLLQLKSEFSNIEFDYFQTNVEGELINKLQEYNNPEIGIILNAGGYTHTSVALADAIKAINAKVIEVHISNIFSRESFRQNSLTAANCIGVITGFGLYSYKLAVIALLNK